MPAFHQPSNSLGNHSYNVFLYDNIDYGLHFHKNYELIYVIKGAALCSVNNKTKQLTQGDFAFCLSNEVHSIKSLGEAKIWIGVFSEDFIHEFRKCQAGKTGSDFVFRCSDVLMNYLEKNFIKSELSDAFMIKSCLYAICSEYLSKIPLQENKSKKAALMNRVIDHIENNYKNTLTLSSVAANLGYEYSYFSKIFNSLFSMKFNDYLNLYRFNEACAMLSKTDMPIIEVSYESGFQSLRSFNHIFKKISGMSPREYRNNKNLRILS